jgi:ribosome-associated protein
MENDRPTRKSPPSPRDLAKIIVAVSEEKAAFDFCTIDLRGRSEIADYFVLMSCGNERHIKAVAAEIQAHLKREWRLKPFHRDGELESHWVVLDYGNVIVHVFLEDIRTYYDLEDLWKKGRRPSAPPNP